MSVIPVPPEPQARSRRIRTAPLGRVEGEGAMGLVERGLATRKAGNQVRIVSSSGLDIPAEAFDDHFVEEHAPHSNALHSRLRDGGSYMVGPLARYSLAFDALSPLAQEAARNAGLDSSCRNPFQSIIVRGVELLYAIEEALRLIAAYEQPDPPALALEPRNCDPCISCGTHFLKLDVARA